MSVQLVLAFHSTRNKRMVSVQKGGRKTFNKIKIETNTRYTDQHKIL